ncbi:MAG: histidine triad nucleotide-binding protein [Selenomonadaceae bacterium]|nr:histidine triad nucleotide-binding protein [Selenomonadaceae bacterium]MBR0101940.1 histidine triad nucleotide-binding protein [Selenomonadaceae bacterium]
MSDCIFCKIAAGEVPSQKVYEDDTVIAFKDLSPKAPIHVLIVPKKHIQSIAHFQAEDKELAAHIFVDVVPKLAADFGVADAGFRLTINTGKDGGQTVPHLHVHFLAKRQMTWPPG